VSAPAGVRSTAPRPRRYPDPADAPVGAYLTALTDFETDATAGSRQLITLATSSDGRLLGSLRDWSTQQADRLLDVAPNLPDAARNRESATHALLDKITTRAEALSARMDCFQITSGSYDDIGALPATSACEHPAESRPAPTTGATAPSVPAPTDNSAPPTGPETPSAPLPPASPTPGLPPVPVPGATVSVPAPVPSAPVPGSSTPEEEQPPPLIELPPLLPGLPGVSIG
jgi:hypothetical protein